MIKMFISAFECNKDNIINLLINNKKITSRKVVTALIQGLLCGDGKNYLTTDRLVISMNRRTRGCFYVIRGNRSLAIYSLYVDKNTYSKLFELHTTRINNEDVIEKYTECVRNIVSNITIVYS